MIATKIDILLNQADELTRMGDYDAALSLCNEAVYFIPEPFIDEPKFTEIITVIGDLYYLKGELDRANRTFSDVMLCPDATVNEYIRLRRGQIAFDLKDMTMAKIELTCAYMNGGIELFYGENPKYLAFIEPIIKNAKG